MNDHNRSLIHEIRKIQILAKGTKDMTNNESLCATRYTEWLEATVSLCPSLEQTTRPSLGQGRRHNNHCPSQPYYHDILTCSSTPTVTSSEDEWNPLGRTPWTLRVGKVLTRRQGRQRNCYHQFTRFTKKLRRFSAWFGNKLGKNLECFMGFPHFYLLPQIEWLLKHMVHV